MVPLRGFAIKRPLRQPKPTASARIARGREALTGQWSARIVCLARITELLGFTGPDTSVAIRTEQIGGDDKLRKLRRTD